MRPGFFLFLGFILKITKYYCTSAHPTISSTLINKELHIFEPRLKCLNKLNLTPGVPLPRYHPYPQAENLQFFGVFLYITRRTKSNSTLMVSNKSRILRILLGRHKRFYVHKYNWICSKKAEFFQFRTYQIGLGWTYDTSGILTVLLP